MNRVDYRNINRYDNGSINYEFYRRQASHQRSTQAWDILSHIRQHLPFLRRGEK